MRNKTKNQYIVAAIWCVAMSGVAICNIVSLLIRLDKLPRVRQYLRRITWYICCYVTKMHAYQHRFCQEHNTQEAGQ